MSCTLTVPNDATSRWGFSALYGLLLVVSAGCQSSSTPEIHSESSPSKAVSGDLAPRDASPFSAAFRPSEQVVAPVTQEVTPEISARAQLLFVDQASERGLKFVWPDQPKPMTALEAFGAGCVVFDSDNDGWQDVLLIGNPAPAFFRNEGGGRFQDRTKESGLQATAGHWTGGSIGDFDGDGLLDVLLTGYQKLALYKNLDGRRFRDETTSAGLDPANGGFWGASSGFMDLDRDGWVDLVILNYVVFGPETKKYCEYAHGIVSGCGPRSDLPEFGQIWRNTGTSSFQMIPAEQAMKQTHGVGMVLAFTDLDDDGLMDFYIGNDGVAADLLHNQGDFRFENMASIAGVATSDNGRPLSAMSADWADFDRDGRLDLFVTNWFDLSSALFQSLGNTLFVDCAKGTDIARITRNSLGFGSKWIDFDNDGWPDLLIANGHVNHNSAEIYGSGVPYRQPIQLLWNHLGQQFIDIVPQLGVDVQRPLVGRGCATADFDQDGRVDLLVVDFEGPVMLLMNQTDSRSHWLKLDLHSSTPNRFAYGARAVGKSGDRVWIADLSPTSSFLSSSDPRIHWGLGDITRLETLTIRWPSGAIQTLENVAVDQILRIEENRP